MERLLQCRHIRAPYSTAFAYVENFELRPAKQLQLLSWHDNEKRCSHLLRCMEEEEEVEDNTITYTFSKAVNVAAEHGAVTALPRLAAVVFTVRFMIQIH